MREIGGRTGGFVVGRVQGVVVIGFRDSIILLCEWLVCLLSASVLCMVWSATAIVESLSKEDNKV